MRFLHKTAILLLVCVAVCSCKREKTSNDLPMDLKMHVDPRSDASMTRTEKDTAEILSMTKNYLELLKAGKTDNALNMLVEFKGDTVMPLSRERKKQIEASVKAFPVLSYDIDEIRMYSENDTEVRFHTEFFKKEETDKRPNTIQCVLNFRRISNVWYVSMQQRSIENNYRTEE